MPDSKFRCRCPVAVEAGSKPKTGARPESRIIVGVGPLTTPNTSFRDSLWGGAGEYQAPLVEVGGVVEYDVVAGVVD